ncbi:hypothetical protein OAT10_00070 [Luminiphilus sp.]|nr:hypothetical protein [Luminiphilus sp.]
MAQNANLNKQPIGYIRQVIKVNSEDLDLVYTDSGILYMFVSDVTREQTITLPKPDIVGQEFEFLWAAEHDSQVFNRIIQSPTGHIFKGGIFHQHNGNNSMNLHQPDETDDRILTFNIGNDDQEVKTGSCLKFFSDGSSWIVSGLISCKADIFVFS